MGRTIATAAALAISLAGPARGDFVSFEAEGAGRGGAFTGKLDSPLTIGLATFTGGELLNHQAGTAIADATAVYATTNFVAGAYTNPLVITFSVPVGAFSLLVTNGSADSYSVEDNLGDIDTEPIAAGGSFLYGLPGSGITRVTVESAASVKLGGVGQWNFAIDDVEFAAVPGP